MAKKPQKRKGFPLLTVPFHSSSSNTVRAGTQSGKTKAEAVTEVMDECFLVACSVYFLTEPRISSLGVVPPTVGWALSYPSVSKKILYRLAYSLIL